MAVYAIQIEYRQTKTWYVEAETVDAVKAIMETDLEDFDPTIYADDATIQAVTKVEGKISKKFKDKIIQIQPQNPEER